MLLRAFAALALTVLFAACAVGEASRPTVEANACYASAEPVAEALEALVGPVPEACHAMIGTYTVEYVTEEQMPCESDNGRVIGCSFNPPWPHIYVLHGANNAKLVDIAAHEWLHVIAHCAYGNGDSDHTRPELWGKGLDSVLGLALSGSPTGPCLTPDAPLANL